MIYSLSLFLPYWKLLHDNCTQIFGNWSESFTTSKTVLLYSFIYRFRSDTKLRDEPAYYLMQVVCWCVTFCLSALLWHLLWWLYYEDHLLNGVKILFHFFSRNVIGFYHHFHLVFHRKLLLPSLRIFHVRSCQYLKKTLNGLFICLTTFQHGVYIEISL